MESVLVERRSEGGVRTNNNCAIEVEVDRHILYLLSSSFIQETVSKNKYCGGSENCVIPRSIVIHLSLFSTYNFIHLQSVHCSLISTGSAFPISTTLCIYKEQIYRLLDTGYNELRVHCITLKLLRSTASIGRKRRVFFLRWPRHPTIQISSTLHVHVFWRRNRSVSECTYVRIIQHSLR